MSFWKEAGLLGPAQRSSEFPQDPFTRVSSECRKEGSGGTGCGGSGLQREVILGSHEDERYYQTCVLWVIYIVGIVLPQSQEASEGHSEAGHLSSSSGHPRAGRAMEHGTNLDMVSILQINVTPTEGLIAPTIWPNPLFSQTLLHTEPGCGLSAQCSGPSGLVWIF